MTPRSRRSPAVFGTPRSAGLPPEQVEALVDWTTLAVGKVGEMGEFRSTYVTESGETISLYTIGGITGVSRQLVDQWRQCARQPVARLKAAGSPPTCRIAWLPIWCRTAAAAPR